MDIGDRLRHFRKRTGLSQRKLSKKAGWHENTVQQAERGSNITLRVLEDILEACGTTTAEFFQEHSPRGNLPQGHVLLHQQLQDILDGPKEWSKLAKIQVESLHERMLAEMSKKAASDHREAARA